MNLSSFMGAGWAYGPQVLCDDDGILLCRVGREGADGKRDVVLAVLSATEHPTPQSLERLAHEYELRDELDSAWAAKPLELLQDRARTILVLEDLGGEPLTWQLGAPMEMAAFLRLAIELAATLGKVHQRGLLHKDVKPANILVNRGNGKVRLTGFGFASRRARERQSLAPPEQIAGTLAYMAPEQTGRMNRSIDLRSDLYALGVTLYQMLTGALPFTASDPMEWVHCHVARKPPPPDGRLENIPAAVSQLVMKLLAKMAEERYQTAAGAERDLRHCLAEWEQHGRIDDFPLGQHDTPDRLQIPEKLYGRAHEVERLLDAFNRVVTRGAPELVLVSGYSGIGKSSVVNELHKALVPLRGLFASGKFDQHKRDIPYATLAQAFQNLVSPLLARSDTELGGWRHDFLEALGPNGQLIVELIPELKLIIGDQGPVPELSPQHAQSRFQHAFERFIGVFARAEHPLVLFLDDLQWLDTATLDLLHDLLTRSDPKHLMLIGAYRDNEVDAAHPLMRMIDAVKSSGEPVTEITLAPLGRAHLGQLLAETLRCDPERVALLAQLVLDKTGGNPFFAIQFMFSLLDEGLLTFDHDAARWSWDLERIHAKRYTENVVDLMLGKLTRLPAATQTALRQMSCLGNTAETAMLAVVLGTSEKQVHSDLWPAVRQELVEPLAGAYRFVHDRFQEAAYALIPEDERSAAHLRIGRLLAARTAPEAIEDNVFEIVSQLNRGAALITATTERENLAELNLLAGKRAKAATAFGMALTHFRAGDAMLAEDRWERHHGLSFALALNRAECEFLTGEHAAAKMLLAELSGHATTLPDLAAVTRLQMEPNDRDVEIALNYLRRVGINCSAQPTPDEVALEYERMWQQIGERPIEALLELPRLTDPVASGTMDVLTVLVSPAWYITDDLRRLIIARMANLSMEYGNSDASCLAYILLGTVLGPDFSDYGAGYRFAQLGLDLVERLDSDRFKARVYLGYGSWSRNIRAGRPLLRKAFDAAQQVGDFNYASFTYHHLVTHLLACGDPLAEVQREAEAGLDYARRAQVDLAVDRVIGQLQLIRTLRGLTPRFGSFDDAGFNEEQFERRLEAEPNLTHAAYWYWIRKLQARVLSDDPAAIAVAAKAEQYLWTAKALFDRVAFHFYAALAVAARTDAASAECAPHLATLAGHHRQLQEWSDICPEDFADRAALVGAEIARIEGRELDAMRLYDRAIGAARASGFVQNEAIANELAGRFYATRGFEKIAYTYLRDARYAYLRWGADAKARQLERLFPRLHVAEDGIAAGKPGDMVQQMDVTAVVKASQAVSSEIELPKLIETLMKIALQNAGADRGLLILSRQNDFRIEAEGQSSGDDFSVVMRQAPVSGPDCPEALLRYVIRTQKTLILDDASRPSPLCEEDYVHRRHPRSILCLPLMKQGRLIGLLYFENTLATHAFTPDRVAVLELLAAQAAISLENTLLYRDLREREARIGRLVDSNIIGILFWDAEGDVSYANDAFLNMTGYTRQELVSGAIDWREMTPAEYRAHDTQRVDRLRSTGQAEPREKEFFRKDGSRVPVLIGSALLAGSDEIISFVLDLTARKQAEEKTRLLMEQAHDAILVLDQDGLVIEANRTASVMLGRPREDIVGRPLRSVADPSDELDSLLAPGSTGLVQLRLAGADGNDLDAEFSAARVSTGGQELVIVIGRDITARLRLEQQLRQAQKMDAIGQLTGGVAHDFNNLLTVITGTIEILIDGLADRPELAAIGHMIDEAAARGADLTKALLAFARKQPLQPRVTDINNLIVDTAKLLRPTLGEQVEIGSTLDPECWRALIDPSQLSTALINLAVNARDAMPAGGRITFGTANVSFAPPASETGAAEMAGDYIMVTVRDNGSGIPAAIRDKVFEPFFTTKELGKGTGLGLSMVYGFVRQSGGHVRIDSEEGQGTTISLYLPRGEQDASLSSAAPVGGPQRGNETILVVEDDALVRSYVVTQLEGLGYHTISAANGPEALALVNQGLAFDLLFTDVIMPGGMNGRELADAVSRLRPGVAILYMSGYPEAAMTQDGRLEPGVTLLNKPYRTADMARMIRQVLGSSADQDGSH